MLKLYRFALASQAKDHAKVAAHMARIFDYTGDLLVLATQPFQQRVLKGTPVVGCFEDENVIARCTANVTMIRYSLPEYVSFAS